MTPPSSSPAADDYYTSETGDFCGNAMYTDLWHGDGPWFGHNNSWNCSQAWHPANECARGGELELRHDSSAWHTLSSAAGARTRTTRSRTSPLAPSLRTTRRSPSSSTLRP